MSKTCNKCGETKETGYFRKDKYSKDGYTSICKRCIDYRYDLICEECGNKFKGSHKKQKFCSNTCKSRNYSNKHTVIIKCDFCDKEYAEIKSEYKRRKNHYCSMNCKNKHHSKLISFENHPNWKGGMVKVKCSYCNIDMEIKKDRMIKREFYYCSHKCMGNHRKELYVGENNPKYNFDKTDEERLEDRKYLEYTEFVKQVLSRDNYICDCCNKTYSGNMEVHHLNSYNWDIENRTNSSNGITLCKECHKTFHSIYGYGNNTKEQYIEYKRLSKSV